MGAKIAIPHVEGTTVLEVSGRITLGECGVRGSPTGACRPAPSLLRRPALHRASPRRHRARW